MPMRKLEDDQFNLGAGSGVVIERTLISWGVLSLLSIAAFYAEDKWSLQLLEFVHSLHWRLNFVWLHWCSFQCQSILRFVRFSRGSPCQRPWSQDLRRRGEDPAEAVVLVVLHLTCSRQLQDSKCFSSLYICSFYFRNLNRKQGSFLHA